MRNPFIKVLLIVGLVVLGAQIVLAAASFTATQTVANVPLEEIPAITFAGGVDEVLATLTIGFDDGALPEDGDSILIGSCTINFATTTAAVTDCGADNTATIPTSLLDEVPLTATEIADLFVYSIATATSTNHGLLTVATTTATTTRFTAAVGHGSEISSDLDPGAANAGVIEEIESEPGVAEVVATANLTITGTLPAGASDQTIDIDGVEIDLGALALTAVQVADEIVYQLTGGDDGAYTVATTTTTNVRLTRSVAGVAGDGDLAVADAIYGGIAQEVVFTPANASSNNRFWVKINGVNYNFVGSTVKAVVEGLDVLLADSSDVTCSEDDVSLTCTSAVPGTAFTYSATVSTGSRSGSGGGSVAPRPDVPPVPASPSPAPAAIAHAAPQAAFLRTLVAGISGADVKNLQQLLNANGFTVAASGVGSVGSETEFFGPATRVAVIKFQLAHGVIASENDPGAGIVGPMTRAKLAELGAGVSADRVALIASLQAQLNELIERLRQMQEMQGE